MKIICVLHGGLGNQLYQFLISAAWSAFHDARMYFDLSMLANYQAARAFELNPLLDCNHKIEMKVPSVIKPLIAARLPKLRAKLTGQDRILSLPGLAIVDGYFQSWSGQHESIESNIALIVRHWRGQLCLQPPCYDKPLLHLRLKDFFNSDSQCREFVADRLRARPGASIMTDDEGLVASIVDTMPGGSRYNLCPSSNFTAMETLKEMSKYREIVTNGSSLAAWAALLSGGQLSSDNIAHITFHNCALGALARAG
jgi:hypothetical protein